MISHLTAVWRYRHFLLALVRLDLRLRYRRSAIGVGWSLLNPILMTTVLTVVFINLLAAGDKARYIPHLLLGMAVWGFLKESAISGCRTLIQNESYIRQSPLPYGIYPLRTVLGQAIHGGIGLGVAIAVTILIQQTSIFPPSAEPPAVGAHLMILAIIPGVLMAVLTAWALATIFAFVNVYFQDTQHLMEVGAQFLFYLTPIIYFPSQLAKPPYHLLLLLNPANIYLELIREPLTTGQLPTQSAFLLGTVCTAVMLGLAAGTVAWLQKKVIFHL